MSLIKASAVKIGDKIIVTPGTAVFEVINVVRIPLYRPERLTLIGIAHVGAKAGDGSVHNTTIRMNINLAVDVDVWLE